MSKANQWSAFGNYNKAVKANFMAQAFAVIIAMATFSNPSDTYPWLMSVLVLLGSAWLGYWAWKGRSVVGLFTPVVALFFIDPLIGGSLFHQPLWFMLIQSASALLFAAGAYTYMRTGTSTTKGKP